MEGGVGERREAGGGVAMLGDGGEVWLERTEAYDGDFE